VFIPDWMKQQDNAFLIIALLLTLWLWLLVSRREEVKIEERKTPLSPNELGRTVFSYCLSKDLKGYRSLFLNAREAHDKLGSVAEEFLEQRSVELLQKSFSQLTSQILIGTVYVGIDEQEKSKIVIIVRLPDNQQVSVPIGSVTVVGRVLRLLEPHINPEEE
jgi:hypothetical protein